MEVVFGVRDRPRRLLNLPVPHARFAFIFLGSKLSHGAEYRGRTKWAGVARVCSGENVASFVVEVSCFLMPMLDRALNVS